MSEKNKMSLDTEEQSLLQSLDQQHNWDGLPMCKYQNFWCPVYAFHPLLAFQRNFRARDTDIVLASVPKSGTTWLKSLLFSVVDRHQFAIDQSPLLTTNAHKFVQSFECNYYADHDDPDLDDLPQPRLFSTHLPHQALATSLIDSKCKIVYVCRNPLDQFVSERHFLLKARNWPDEPYGEVLSSLDEAFDLFCDGVHAFGPFCDHLLGYWRASLENPDRVLFLRYEDVKRDPVSNVRKISEFVGLPFSEEEEQRGLVEAISELCSFEKLKDLEINKTGILHGSTLNSYLFRKGDVGDWANNLTPAMAERMTKIVEAKLSGSGLVLDI